MTSNTLLSLNDTAAILGVTTDRVLSMVSSRTIDFVMKDGWKWFKVEAVVKVHENFQDERNSKRYGGTGSLFEKATKNWWD